MARHWLNATMDEQSEEERVAVALPLSLVKRVEAVAAGTGKTREEAVAAAVEEGIGLDECLAELEREVEEGGGLSALL